MSEKKVARLRRAKRSRMKMRELRVARLTVHRTPRHIYAQVIDAEGGKVLAAASTVEKDLRNEATGNVEAAKKVGALSRNAPKRLADKVAFDRSGHITVVSICTQPVKGSGI